jgi:putative heme-binding domain-containing protein
MATRYLAWHALRDLGPRAERALQAVWNESGRPEMRARALWLLTKLPNGTVYLDQALQDDDPNLRITALRAARQREGVDVLPYVRQLASDPSAAVRREAAIALRHHPAPEASALWADLAAQYDGEDRWYLEALGIAADRQWARFFDAYLDGVGDPLASAAGRDVVWRARTEAALPLLADLSADAEQPLESRLRYFRAFDFHAPSEAKRTIVVDLLRQHADDADVRRLLLARLDAEDLEAAPEVEALVRRTLADVEGTDEFFRLLGRYQLEGYEDTLYEMALAGEEQAAQAARLLVTLDGLNRLEEAVRSGKGGVRAVAAIAAVGNAEATTFLKEVMLSETYPHDVREAAVRGWGSGWEGEPRLLEVIEAGGLPPSLLRAAGETLSEAWRVPYREAGEALLERASRSSSNAAPPAGTPTSGSKAPTERIATVPALPNVRQLVDQSGDVERGAVIFTRVCASCHVVDGNGIDFGPSLSEIGDKLPKEALYESILRPSKGISFGYEGVMIETTDGAHLVGFIASETETDLTLRMPGGVDRVISVSNIAAREPLYTSLMPAGLHRSMSEQELIDLVEYLSSLKK